MWTPVLICFYVIPYFLPSPLHSVEIVWCSPLVSQLVFAAFALENYNINIPPLMSCPMFTIVKPLFGRDIRSLAIRQPDVPSHLNWEFLSGCIHIFVQTLGLV